MTENIPQVPESRTVTRKRTSASLVWLIPIVAAVAGAWIGVTRILAEGPTITIVLDTAQGLEEGKTRVDYNGVRVGTLDKIRLSDDHQKVIATAKMAPKTKGFLVEDTTFWVVRPRISGGAVSGLGTLLSGAYIDMYIGESKKPRARFEALEEPPVVEGGTKGRSFRLETPDLGSLDNGTPIFFRRLKVGEVASYELQKDGKSFLVKAFVEAPYDQYVNPNTRFWHASGVDVSLSAEGFNVQTQSLVSILIGGIAFETSTKGPVLPPADNGAHFKLFQDRTEAFAAIPRDPHTYVLEFDAEVRGLNKGAPVELRGISIGEVLDVHGRLDPETYDFRVEVEIQLDAEPLGIDPGYAAAGVDRETHRRKVIDSLVAHGVRAQLRTGNLLSGALYVALDFFPDVSQAKVDWAQHPARLPTTPAEFAALEARVASILDSVSKIPFAQIGVDLKKTIVQLDRTLETANGTLDNASTLIAPNSVLGQELEGTLHEVSGAARAVRLLADYLEQHPESLLRGKTGEAQ